MLLLIPLAILSYLRSSLPPLPLAIHIRPYVCRPLSSSFVLFRPLSSSFVLFRPLSSSFLAPPLVSSFTPSFSLVLSLLGDNLPSHVLPSMCLHNHRCCGNEPHVPRLRSPSHSACTTPILILIRARVDEREGGYNVKYEMEVNLYNE